MRPVPFAPRTVSARLIDAGLAAVLTALSVATLVEQNPGEVSVGALVLSVLSVAPVATRQSAPVLSMLVIGAAVAAFALLGYGDSPSGAIGLLIALFSVAALRPRAVAAGMYAVAALVSVLIFETDDGVLWSQVVQAVVVCLAAWGLGESTRRWMTRAALAAADSERALSEERTRIAQELHDVVTHHMSVVSLQTGVAGYLLDLDPPAAREALTAASGAGRDALDEMRRLLETMRGGAQGEAPYAPAPGLDDLDGLVDRLGAGGLQVEVRREGRARPLPPGLDLTAFRVVQESLTNVLRHSGVASARVAITYGDRLLEVEVHDDGATGAAGAEPGSSAPAPGRGISGMRERVELYGGVLEVGRQADGGFRVLARLPVPEQLTQAVR